MQRITHYISGEGGGGFLGGITWLSEGKEWGVVVANRV